MKYRRKPEIVEAVQWTGENLKEIGASLPHAKLRVHPFDRHDGTVGEVLLIDGEGWCAEAIRREWVVRSREGVTVEAPDAFAEAFEPVEEETDERA